jgi:predicted permease
MTLGGLFRRLRALVSRERFRRELEEEMSLHRALVERDLRADGMSAEEARRKASRHFGNPERLKERSTEAVGFRWETVGQDVRYAARQLRQNPGFTVVITLTLALSIGANSAIFSVIDALLLKSLPYPEPERLVRVFLSNADYPMFSLNPFDFRDYRARSKSFESMAAYTRGDVQLAGTGEAIKLNGFGVTAGYFRTLGIAPQLGQEFNEKNEVPGNGMEVLISDGLWRTRLGADANIVGKKITLNSQPFTVAGVMPRGMEHPGNDYHAVPFGKSVDVWWPFSFGGNPAQRGSHFVEGIGRLKQGVTVAQAQSELNAIMAQMAKEHAGDKGWTVKVVSLEEKVVGSNRTLLLVLLGAVGMVLLIACANAANLQLARASARQRELAVRLALGAPRMRLMRQMLTESLLIGLLGGGLGVALAVEGVHALVSLLPAGFPRASEIQVNGAVLGFTVLVSAVTGLLFGLAPALQASRTDPRQGLHEGGRTATGSGRQKRLRSALVVAEVGLACVLLIGAGLMMRSLVNLVRQQTGFSQEHVLTASVNLTRVHYGKDEDIVPFFRRLLPALAALPGVESVGVGSDLPWTGYDENAGFRIEGKTAPPHEEFHARYHSASPDYFKAIGTPLIEGRFVAASDGPKAPTVVDVNEAMAKRYWPGEEAVGKRFTFEDAPKEKDWITIVGVVGDVKDRPNSAAAEPAYWFPLEQGPPQDASIVIRSSANPQALAEEVRKAVREIDPELAVSDMRTMDQIADAGIATPRFGFFLVGLFAAIAMVLAGIGTYGVISYSVSQRIPEFGLRLALGAPRGQLLRLVLTQAAKLAIAGTAAGVVAALAMARVMASMIYQVSPADPATFGGVAVMVIGIALLACYVPARRATKASPMAALRSE